jgi:hypothetical protein
MKWSGGGSNSRPVHCERDNTPSVSQDSKGLTPTLPAACTSACTSEGENENAGTLDADQGDPLAKLAAALLTLSPADRERLVAMLAGHQGDQGAR